MRVGGATSQLDPPSLTLLSVAGCGRLQLGVPHLATSVDYCKYLILDLTFCGSKFSTGRQLAIEDFTFTLLPLPQRTVGTVVPSVNNLHISSAKDFKNLLTFSTI